MNGDLYEKAEYALSLIAKNDENGVNLLYESMSKTMLFVARGVVKDEFAAEDVVQESFLKIVKNIHKYEAGTNAYGWVCKIVRNTALNSIYGKTKHPIADLDEFGYIPDEKDSAEKSETRILVERLMNSLAPPIVKQMVYMKYFLDMTVREIAVEIGKSKSYVAKEIAKAEKFMREMLDE